MVKKFLILVMFLMVIFLAVNSYANVTPLDRACRNAFYDDYGARIAKLDMSMKPLEVCETHPYCCPIQTGIKEAEWLK